MKTKIGFIGLGLMGRPMATNILKKGFSLSVYNRTKSKAVGLGKIGATVCDTPKEVVKDSDIVIIMVTGPKDVEEMLFGNNGVTKGAKQNLIIIDMSTIGPESAKKFSKRLSEKGTEFIDAPVTGSTFKAEIGELTIFVGGNRKVFDKILPVLEAMGTNIHYCGQTGSGQAVKLINNLFVGTSLVALAEGMLLADAEGLDRRKVVQYLENVPAVSAFMKMKMSNLVTEEYKTAFSIANMSKDLDLALTEAKKGGKELKMSKMTAKLYRAALKQGLGNEDNSAVVKVVK